MAARARITYRGERRNMWRALNRDRNKAERKRVPWRAFNLALYKDLRAQQESSK